MSTRYRSRGELQYLRDDALQDYLNRGEFQYDLNGDALYRQYKDRYVELGRQAMQDTMGQAAALTGGYGSSYAQSVGQQAYQGYLRQLGDVVPELYKLAYDRYQDEGDRLYRTYETWAQLEQQAADREQQEREYAAKNGKGQTGQLQSDDNTGRTACLGKGERPKYDDPTVMIKYDNQNVTTGNIMVMQRVIGQEETGLWTHDDRRAAGGMEADAAWQAYQNGQLQNRTAHPLGDQGLPNGDVRTMERVLGLPEDGYWSEEDKKAAGGMSEAIAWEAYQRGLLQKWR